MQDYEQARLDLIGLCEAAGLTIESQFVPFSQSRQAGTDSAFGDGMPWESLNWKVTLKHGGREIMRTDYSQGLAHAPAMKAKFSAAVTQRMRESLARVEIESGTRARFDFMDRAFPTRKPIPGPELVDVVSSIAADSSVLDYARFEDWADCYGYDRDSRSAESTYRKCLEIALAMRAAVGESILSEMRDAANRM